MTVNSSELCRNIDLWAYQLSSAYEPFTLIVNGILTLIVASCGIFGNIRSMIYLNRSQIGGRMTSTLSALALWDIFLLLSAIGYYSIPRIVSGTSIASLFTYSILFFHPLAAASFTASALLVSAVVVQQYFAVSRPLLPRQLTFVVSGRNYREMAIKPGLYLSIFSILLRIPSIFELSVQACFDQSQQTESVEVKATDLRENKVYKKVYLIGSKILFDSLGPVLVVTLSILAIIIRLHSAVRAQSRLMHHPRGRKRTLVAEKESHITYILLMLGLKFLLTHVLPMILDFLESFTRIIQDQIHVFLYLVDISNFLVLLNSATNFLVYARKIPTAL